MSIISQKKLFGVVIFKQDGLADVVPLSWYKEDGKCFFPIPFPKIGRHDLRAKVEALEEPNDNYRKEEAALKYKTCKFIALLLFY